MNTRLFPIMLTSLALLLSGCMVGPKYVQPATPTAPAFKEQPPESFKESQEWQAAQPGDQRIRGAWWAMFGDPELNALEDQLTASNQNLRLAEARLREARAAIRFNRSALFPTISTSPSVTNERVSAHEPYFPASEANNGTGNFRCLSISRMR
jgi:outer membrane protein TolC